MRPRGSSTIRRPCRIIRSNRGICGLADLFPEDTPARTDVVTGRRLILGNQDVRISYVVAAADSPLYRNAVGDEIVYIESGRALVETVFGPLPVRQGDYVLIPRATTHRWLTDSAEPLRACAIEANGHIVPTKRYLSRFGQLLEHAPYCERDLHGPAELCSADGTDVEVLVKHRGAPGYHRHALCVRRAPVRRGGVGRLPIPVHLQHLGLRTDHRAVHQPPPAHQSFEGDNFVICNFVPRKVDYHRWRFSCRTTTATSTPTR